MKLLLFLYTTTSLLRTFVSTASLGEQTATTSLADQTTTTSEEDQTESSGLGNVQIDVRCHSNLFDEAVELLITHTVERLEGQLLLKENALKEKENGN